MAARRRRRRYVRLRLDRRCRRREKGKREEKEKYCKEFCWQGAGDTRERRLQVRAGAPGPMWLRSVTCAIASQGPFPSRPSPEFL